MSRSTVRGLVAGCVAGLVAFGLQRAGYDGLVNAIVTVGTIVFVVQMVYSRVRERVRDHPLS